MIPFGQAEGISNVGDIWSMRERDAMRGMRARGAQLAGAAMLALTASLLSGCGGASLTGASPATGSPSLGDRFSQLFGSKSQAAEAPSAPQQVQNSGLTCPRVSIRSGAATYAVGLPGKDASGMDLRYQATIIRTARDCNLNNGTISARIGIMGRIIVGPAGAPPSVEVPLRVAVVDGGVSEKTIFTKAYRTTVAVSEEGLNNFSLVAEDVVYPAPTAGNGDNYVFYIGFDPHALRPEPRRRHRRR